MKKIISILLAVMAVIVAGVNPIKIKEGTCYGLIVHNFPRAMNHCQIEVFEEEYENRRDVKWEYWSDEELRETLQEQYAQKRIVRIEYDGDYYEKVELVKMMAK